MAIEEEKHPDDGQQEIQEQAHNIDDDNHQSDQSESLEGDSDDGRDNEYEEEEEEESDEELRGVNKLLASAHDPEPAIGYVTKREATKRQIVATGNVARKIFKRAKKKGAKVIFMNK